MRFHFFHTYIPVGTQLLNATRRDSWGDITYQGDMTRILMRCNKCDRVAVEDVRGAWTLDQIKGRDT